MSHYSVLLFHSYGVDGNMSKRHYDATEDDGASFEFQVEMTKEAAEKKYKDAIGKKGAYTKEDYPTLEEYMEAENSHLDKNEDGDYGYNSNIDGMFDWYDVGGRWSNLLPDFSNKKELQEEIDEALDMKNKNAYDMFRDDAELYVRVKQMSFEDACAFFKIGGTNSIEISDKIPAEMILDWWIASYNADANTKGSYTRKNIIDNVTGYFILEDNNEVINGVSMELFINTYNYYAKLNKKKSAEYKFSLTMLDLHT